MKTAGILLLTFLILYKGFHGAPFQQKWWGILGLIGWTYVICASVYLFTRESLVRNLFRLGTVYHSGIAESCRRPAASIHTK